MILKYRSKKFTKTNIFQVLVIAVTKNAAFSKMFFYRYCDENFVAFNR